MKRKFVFSINENYHIYNRGVEKRTIFLDTIDYERFVFLLEITNNSKPVLVRELKKEVYNHKDERDVLVDIGSWCLMPNHFHLLLHERVEGGISKFMSKLLTGYTMYFNKKYERSGSLFQGTYKAEHADSDEYLKYLFSYIHLNPVKNIDPNWKERGLTLESDLVRKYLLDYKYSSFCDYVREGRKEAGIIDKKAFPDYFSSESDLLSNHFEWLKYSTHI
jgi:putative transposase